MGLHSKFLNQINNVFYVCYFKLNNLINQICFQDNEVIIVDIDTGTIKIPDTIYLIDFPKSNIDLLKTKLNETDFNYVQTKKLTSPSRMDWKSAEIYEKSLNQQQNTKLLDIFLQFFVILFG